MFDVKKRRVKDFYTNIETKAEFFLHESRNIRRQQQRNQNALQQHSEPLYQQYFLLFFFFLSESNRTRIIMEFTEPTPTAAIGSVLS